MLTFPTSALSFQNIHSIQEVESMSRHTSPSTRERVAQRFCTPERKYLQRHRIFLSTLTGRKKELRKKNNHPTFAHQQQSETRTKERMSPKTAHTVITLMGLHEVAFILQVASWRLQSSRTERTEPFNHSHRDWFTKLAFLWWGTVIYICSEHAGTRRSCMSNPSLTLCTSGTE